MIYPVILSGGSGTRLWPLSRAAVPKQLLPLTSEFSMLQETVRRLTDLAGVGAPLVEHWVVVRGTAKVTRGEETFLVGENESTYISLGIPHLLQNPGKVILEMIEVQSESYLGEDDIVRFDDSYGRCE